MQWVTHALPAVGALAALAAAFWSIAQLIRSSGAYARYQQWSQIARDTDNPKVREYASARAESYLLDHLAGTDTLQERLSFTLIGIAFLALMAGIVTDSWSAGIRGRPLAYGALHGDLLQRAIVRDVAALGFVVGCVALASAPTLLLRSKRAQLGAELGLKTLPPPVGLARPKR
ncbi:MAG: hypothetical protein BGO26_00130 [Actinobacteria bacterium 69-20]|nr:MAG: hypothetical protein BGO26_00130 [Actinobacteria bacterium 69-20]